MANFGTVVTRENVSHSGQSEVNYFLTDHLGSVRVIVDGAGVVKERNDYYPFGARHVRGDYPEMANRLLYNGKEEQVTGDLDYLDYGARMYDSGLGRWFGMDPRAEKYPWASPYVYVNNNPIITIDPNGEDLWFVNPDGRVTLALVDPTRNILYALDWDSNITGTFFGSSNDIFSQLALVEERANKRGEVDTEYMKNVVWEKRSSIMSEDYKGEMKDLFLFLADNTMVEWSFSVAKINGEIKYGIATQGMGNKTPWAFDIKNISLGVHSHVNTKGVENEIQGLYGDKKVYSQYPSTFNYCIYMVNSGRMYKLDRTGREHHVGTMNLDSGIYSKDGISKTTHVFPREPSGRTVKFKH